VLGRGVYQALSLTRSGVEIASQAEYAGSIPVIGSTLSSADVVLKRAPPGTTTTTSTTPPPTGQPTPSGKVTQTESTPVPTFQTPH
jgi:hypothetical protein